MAAQRGLLLKAPTNPVGLRSADVTMLVEAFGLRLLRVIGSHGVFAWSGIREMVKAHPTRDGSADEYQVR